MSDKRKPKYVLLLKKEGKKTSKVEVFDGHLFKGYPHEIFYRFRLRVNGKWWPEGKRKYLTKTQIKELFFKCI